MGNGNGNGNGEKEKFDLYHLFNLWDLLKSDLD